MFMVLILSISLYIKLEENTFNWKFGPPTPAKKIPLSPIYMTLFFLWSIKPPPISGVFPMSLNAHEKKDMHSLNGPLCDTFTNNVPFLPQTTNNMFGHQY